MGAVYSYLWPPGPIPTVEAADDENYALRGPPLGPMAAGSVAVFFDMSIGAAIKGGDLIVACCPQRLHIQSRVRRGVIRPRPRTILGGEPTGRIKLELRAQVARRGLSS